jgi:hypothetical protein
MNFMMQYSIPNKKIMNIRQSLIAVICTGWMVFFSGCEDPNNLNLVGTDILPDNDKVAVYADSFLIQASTVKVDSVYAKTVNGLLGEIHDPVYGRLKSDFLCQFYCQENWQFNKTPYKEKVDSAYFDIYYWVSTGDGQTPMQAQIYPVTKPLDKVFYTHINPEDYCDMNQSLGSKVYMAAYEAIYDTTTTSALRYLRIPCPVELGQKFYDETVKNPSSFKDQESFNKFFPGIYVTTNYGSGNIIHVEQTVFKIAYNYAVESSTGADSLLMALESFSVSKEVIQLNRFQDSDTEQLLAANDDYTFLKTPAGIYTRLVIPTKEIAKVIEGRVVNDLLLNLKYMPQEDLLYTLTQPPFLILMPEDSLRTFFINKNVENNATTYVSTNGLQSMQTTLGYNSSSRVYSFYNISSLLNIHIRVKPDEDLRLLLVPVIRSYTSQNSSYYTTEISPYLAPSGIKLRKDKEYMRVAVVSSKYIK